MIALRIPGSGQDVLLITALILDAFQPGPLLALERPDVFYSMNFTYLIANVVMIVIFIILLQLPLKVIKIPVHRRVPVVLTFCVIGVVATNNRLEDGWVILCFGIFESLLAN